MKRNLKYIFIIIVLAIAVMMVMEFANRITEGQQLKTKKLQMEGRITELLMTSVHLKTQVAFISSDEAALRYAYEEQRLIRPGDVRIVPIPQPNLTPEAVPTVISTPKEFANWEYWWALFVDPES
jgi:hypothetical protein